MDDLRDVIEEHVQVLGTVGDGPVRVRVDLGISADFGDVWLKPKFGIEVPVPAGVDQGELLNDYIANVRSFAEGRLLECLVQLASLAGKMPSQGS